MKATYYKPNPGNPEPLPEAVADLAKMLAVNEAAVDVGAAVAQFRKAAGKGYLVGARPISHEAAAEINLLDGRPIGNLRPGMITLRTRKKRGAPAEQQTAWRVLFYLANPYIEAARCSSCNAHVVWLKTATGKTMPVDADTVQTGTPPQYDADAGHVSHFGTCPQAGLHRRAGALGARSTGGRP